MARRSSIQEILQLNKDAGFSYMEAVVMTAIMFAESGGLDNEAQYVGNYTDPASGKTTYVNAQGIAQINLPAHPGVSKEQARDPKFATQYSRKLYLESGFRPWEVYTVSPDHPNSYLKFLMPVIAPVARAIPDFNNHWNPVELATLTQGHGSASGSSSGATVPTERPKQGGSIIGSAADTPVGEAAGESASADDIAHLTGIDKIGQLLSNVKDWFTKTNILRIVLVVLGGFVLFKAITGVSGGAQTGTAERVSKLPVKGKKPGIESAIEEGAI